MKKIILASHGHLASAMKNTVEMIIGKKENIIAFDAYVDDNNEVRYCLEQMISNTDEDIIIVTDLLGGSVNNEAMNFINNKNVKIITGLNLALVLNLLLKESNNENYLNESISESKEMILLLKSDEIKKIEDEF